MGGTISANKKKPVISSPSQPIAPVSVTPQLSTGYNNSKKMNSSPNGAGTRTNSTLNSRDYPIYNPIEDFSFGSAADLVTRKAAFPFDVTKRNIGFVGRHGSGKSWLINALRGLQGGQPGAAGRYPCERMEPFNLADSKWTGLVLWEIPYPSTYSSVNEIYDQNLGFDKFYESHKLHQFSLICLLVADGAPSLEDVAFARIIYSRRVKMIFLSTKTDMDLVTEANENGDGIVEAQLIGRYLERARSTWRNAIMTNAAILDTIPPMFISSPVVNDLLCGKVENLPYKIDDEKLIQTIGLEIGCHYSIEKILNKTIPEIKPKKPLKKSAVDNLPPTSAPPPPIEMSSLQLPSPIPQTEAVSIRSLPTSERLHKTTGAILADAGFEICYSQDDRPYNTLDSKGSKTALNYGIVGAPGVGKSSLINALRGMSGRHPLAAGRSIRPPAIEKFEFDDEQLKYNVSLWELHYPKKISAFFEFIDDNMLCNFAALFIVLSGPPKDADLAFAKIAFRRNANLVFLVSKCDRTLATRSRNGEIPICEMLKTEFVDKGLERFDREIATRAPELLGRVQCFFVSSPVFNSLRSGEKAEQALTNLLHERLVFDFLKQKRLIARMLESPAANEDDQQALEAIYDRFRVD